MAESKGCAQALRRVMRGGAVSTSSPGSGFSNMRDCAATVEVYFTERQIRKKDNVKTQGARRSAEKKETGGNPRPSVLLFGGGGFGSGVRVFLLEALDTAGGGHEFLLAGDERLAVRADFDAQHFGLDGRTSLEGGPACAVHRCGERRRYRWPWRRGGRGNGASRTKNQ